MQITPYLYFDGRCKEAFGRYQQILGGSIREMITYGELPIMDNVPPGKHDHVMHASFVTGDQVLMGTDIPGEYETPRGMYVSLHVTDPAEAERIYHGLAENGTVQVPISETDWAIRFGMLTDQFGIPWIVNCDKPA